MDYSFTLSGITPLLMHRDDVEAADALISWRKDPKNKSISVPGDDRSPPWTWQTYLYHDGEHLVLPQENIMVALRTAGSKISGKGRSTFKSLSQSGLFISTEYCTFRANGAQINLDDIQAFRDEPFSVHKQRVKELGFDLSIKRAKVGSSKHVRIRARFDVWQVTGTIQVIEQAITQDILRQMFEIAGRFAGLCDWRPSSKESPGPYGMFTSELSLIKVMKAG